MGLPDGNQTQTEMILDRAWDTWQAKQGRKLGSVPAWASLFISLALGVFIAGGLSRDVARASEDNRLQETRILLLERELGAINGKLDIILEDRKKK